MNHHGHRNGKVLAILAQAAAADRECPSNNELADKVGFSSASGPSMALTALEREGKILVERFGSGRRVTICATGARTAYAGSERPHWRLRQATADEISQRAEIRRERARQRSSARAAGCTPDLDPPIPETRVDRDPCPRCGVRADIGCAHSRSRISMGAW